MTQRRRQARIRRPRLPAAASTRRPTPSPTAGPSPERRGSHPPEPALELLTIRAPAAWSAEQTTSTWEGGIMSVRNALRATMALVVLSLPLVAGCNDEGAPARHGNIDNSTGGGTGTGG